MKRWQQLLTAHWQTKLASFLLATLLWLLLCKAIALG